MSRAKRTALLKQRLVFVELERAYALVRKDLLARNMVAPEAALILENREHDLHAEVYDLNRLLETGD